MRLQCGSQSIKQATSSCVLQASLFFFFYSFSKSRFSSEKSQFCYLHNFMLEPSITASVFRAHLCKMSCSIFWRCDLKRFVFAYGIEREGGGFGSVNVQSNIMGPFVIRSQVECLLIKILKTEDTKICLLLSMYNFKQNCPVSLHSFHLPPDSKLTVNISLISQTSYLPITSLQVELCLWFHKSGRNANCNIVNSIVFSFWKRVFPFPCAGRSRDPGRVGTAREG